MSLLKPANKIAEGGLRIIGSYAPSDTGPDPALFAITIERLDLVVAEVVGTDNFWWLVPTTQTIPLQPGVATYDLVALLGTPLQFYRRAYISTNPTGISPIDGEIDMLRRDAFEAVREKLRAGSKPEAVYIERNDRPMMSVTPVPTVAGFSVKLTGEMYAADIYSNHGVVPHGFPAAWQLCLEYGLAADIGAGPIRRLPQGEIDDHRRVHYAKKALLMTYNNRENITRPRFTRFIDVGQPPAPPRDYQRKSLVP